MSGCPRCRFPTSSNYGHCKASKKVFNCRRRRVLGVVVAAFAPVANATEVSQGRCPRLPDPSAPGHFAAQLAEQDDPAAASGEAESTEYEVEYETATEDGYISVLYGYGYEYDSGDPIRPPEFIEVKTPRELQAALRVGAFHILLKEHMDMTDAEVEPDLDGLEALNTAVGRVLNTTRSIVGDCFTQPPESFGLTEPVPPGACAILVKEDFLDAPIGTGCLLLESLYVAVAAPAGPSSSVLVLHGAGENSRAIDTNTIDGGIPELYIEGTTFTGFTRDLAPGIRVLQNAILWLDNVTFRDISLIRKARRRSKQPFIQASAVAAYENATLIFANVTFEDNFVFGRPAGDRAVAVAPSPLPIGSFVFTTPRMFVWVWPRGPFLRSSEDPSLAEQAIVERARPELRTIQAVQRQAYLDYLAS